MNDLEIKLGVPHYPPVDSDSGQSSLRRHFIVKGVGYGQAEVDYHIGILPGVRVIVHRVLDNGDSDIVSRGWIDPEHIAQTVIADDELLESAIASRFGGFFGS